MDVRRHITRSCSVEAELAIVAVVLVLWQAVRIPLESDVTTALAHAEDVLALERALSIDIESRVIGAVSGTTLAAALTWLYTNIHLPVLFAFVAGARLLAPDRYPAIRTTFVLSFVPAIFVIGLYPLAPPHWLPGLGFGGPPTQAELGDASGALFHNSTAAAASQHFGFAVLVAAASIWLFPRSRLAWATIAYPALVFLVIVGTGNHYVVDCVVGTLTFALAAAAASVVHREPTSDVAPTPKAVGIAFGYGLVAWGFVSLDLTALGSWDNLFPDFFVLVAGIAAVVAPRLGEREPLTENS
jgi:hypothetical protein